MNYLPTPEQLVAHQFTATSCAGILVFTRHDKQELSFVRLHSTAEPGRFGLTLGYASVFTGTVPNAAAFEALLWAHGWQPVCVPASWQFKTWYHDTYEKPQKSTSNG